MAEDDAADDEPLIPNAAEPNQIRRRKETVKRRQQQAAEFWRAVFGSEVGRREMWGILDSTGAFAQRFGTAPNGAPEPIETQRQEGEHRAGFRLFLSWLALEPALAQQMIVENDPILASAAKAGRKG